ncbi:MAG: hypothetical protein IJZ46_03975 [Bacilli bacterium]|nr:hypothetical protein [Bacilli bacterium]
MKNSKKAWDIFKNVVFILFIFFLINYFQVYNGEPSKRITKKTIITEEKINEFEEDVKNGEQIDIKEYIKEEEVDTTNIISDTGYRFSNVVNDFITDKAIKIFKTIGKLFS